MIDIRRDHPARAKIQPKLHGNQDDREQNANQRDRKTNPVMKKISEGKRKDH